MEDKRLRSKPELILLVGVLLLTAACQQAAPPGPPPQLTECKLWDDAMLGLFNVALYSSLLAPLVLGPLSGFLGRRSWFFTAPRRRIAVVSLGVAVLAILAVPVAPWLNALGQLWFAGIDPRYFSCSTVSFGATGLLEGLISPGVSALSQWPAMILLILGAALLGCVLSIFFSQQILVRLWGIYRKLRGGDE